MRGLFEFGQQHLQNTLDVFEHLVVPDADNTIAICGQLSLALSVGRTIGMLATVDLDDQPTLATKKIRVKATDRFLADELEAA